MGSYSYLTLAKFEVDWGKNDGSQNHSALFKQDEQKNVDYYYADNKIIQKPAYVNTLEHIIPRLELLGYTLEKCKSKIDAFAKDYPYGNTEVTFEDLKDIFSKLMLMIWLWNLTAKIIQIFMTLVNLLDNFYLEKVR